MQSFFGLWNHKILYNHDFPVPTPISQSRHTILMSRIEGYPLRQIVDLPKDCVSSLFASLMALIVRLARAGLIHGDFNEFNIMIREVKEEDNEYEDENDRSIWTRVESELPQIQPTRTLEEEYELQPGERIQKGKGFESVYYDKSAQQGEGDEEREDEEDDDDEDRSRDSSSGMDSDEPVELDEGMTNENLRITLRSGASIEPILIDFPQMVSVEHPNAEYYFDRDVQGVVSFFIKRFRFQSESIPRFRDIVPEDRQSIRETRASQRAERIKEASKGNNGVDHISNQEVQQLGLELDVLGEASGLGSDDKTVSHLDQYMFALKTNAGADDSDQSQSDDDEGDDASTDEDRKRLDDGTLLPPSKIEPITGRGLARQSRRRKEKGSQGRANQRASESSNVQDRVAVERQHRSRVEAKHHGKKSQAGKPGRAWATMGSKAKSSEKALLENSLQF